MEADQVLDLLDLLDSAGLIGWVDGGWGVDALIGEQTRSHSDLDLVVFAPDLAKDTRSTRAAGFEVVRNWLPTAIDFRHADDRAVDLHAIEPTDDGGGDQVQLDGVKRFHYDPPVSGLIGGQKVLCCSLDTQLRAHLGYQPREIDFADMQTLAEHFRCILPPLYARA